MQIVELADGMKLANSDSICGDVASFGKEIGWLWNYPESEEYQKGLESFVGACSISPFYHHVSMFPRMKPGTGTGIGASGATGAITIN